MTASNRWLAIVGAFIALAVIAGIVVTSFARGERVYAEGTPERSVQDYLRAVSDRDANRATSYLAPELATRCGQTPRDGITNRSSSSLRATLDRTTYRGDRQAEVQVRLTETYNESPFSGGNSAYTQVFVLTQADGAWRFSKSPWPLYCPAPTPNAPLGR